jgi:arylsulfatase A-like enzyme
MIVRAPGMTKPGSICETPVTSTDFYPTLLELAGLPLFSEQHRDGVSFVPLLKGKELKRAPLFWHYPHYGNQGGAPGGAVRDGDWKLIEWFEDDRKELFNLRNDPGEQKNLAAQMPEKVKELHAKLVNFRKDVNAVMPTPNPDWPNVSKPEKGKKKKS